MRDVTRKRDCGVSNETKREIKNEPPPGLSLGGDDRNLGIKMDPSLDCKENKGIKEIGMAKDTDSHMAEKIHPVEGKTLFPRSTETTMRPIFRINDME